MPRAPTSRRPELTPRQRWTAALRLADDDPPLLAAALADASPDVVSRPVAEDEGFRALIAACRALRDLPDEAWIERMRRLARERRIVLEVEAAACQSDPATDRPGLVLVASNPDLPAGSLSLTDRKDR